MAGAVSRRRPFAVERRCREERLQLVPGLRQSLELLPFTAGTDILRRAPFFHLRRRHQPGMIVLVALERQADALDGVGDEADRPVVIDGFECIDHAGHVVAAEIGHQRQQLLVAAPVDQLRDRPLIADVVLEMLAERGAALETQRGVHLVRAGVDPALQRLAAGLGECRLHQRAVFHDHHVPAEIAEHGFEFFPEAFANDRIEALAVVVDDPPGVAQPVLPALQQRLEDVALVHFGVADQRDHPPLRAIVQPAMRLDVVLHQRGEQRLRDAEADRAGGEIDVVGILGARRIGLRALVAAEILQLLAGLVPEQVLDGVKHRARMRLHRDAVLRPQHREIQRRHDVGERGRGRLMAADLQPVGTGPDVVGVVDGPRRQPQHFTCQRGQ